MVDQQIRIRTNFERFIDASGSCEHELKRFSSRFLSLFAHEDNLPFFEVVTMPEADSVNFVFIFIAQKFNVFQIDVALELVENLFPGFV